MQIKTLPNSKNKTQNNDMKNTENIHDRFAELMIKLEKENRLEYLEWTARQLDDYWWDTIYRGFPEEWGQEEYESMRKLMDRISLKKQNR